ncbi:MAG: hypothetical protein WD055_00985 [Candidatus Dependentiae bacterium]
MKKILFLLTICAAQTDAFNARMFMPFLRTSQRTFVQLNRTQYAAQKYAQLRQVHRMFYPNNIKIQMPKPVIKTPFWKNMFNNRHAQYKYWFNNIQNSLRNRAHQYISSIKKTTATLFAGMGITTCDQEKNIWNQHIEKKDFSISKAELNDHELLRSRLATFTDQEKPSQAVAAMKYLASFLDNGFWQRTFKKIVLYYPDTVNVVIEFLIEQMPYIAQHNAESPEVITFLLEHNSACAQPIMKYIKKNKASLKKAKHGPKLIALLDTK